MGHFADGVSEFISLLSETRGRSSIQQTKQKYKPNHQQTGLPPQSALPIRGKTKQNKTKTEHKSLVTQTTGPTLGQKPKGRKNSTFFKERIQLSLEPGKRKPQTQYLKKIMKRQRNIAQMKEQTGNTEVQINGKEIGKLLEKECNDSKDDSKDECNDSKDDEKP